MLLKHYFCGRRGGKPLSEAIRPDYTTKKCPENTQPCSESTSLENTFCVAEEDLSECPFTNLFFKVKGERRYYENTHAFVSKDVESFIFVGDKNSDNFPIMRTQTS